MSLKKNVIVFTTRSIPYAIEIGWVRDVFHIEHVTPVPRASSGVAGVVNLKGSIVPLLDIESTLSQSIHTPLAHPGESGILLEIDQCKAALLASAIDEVSSIVMEEVPSNDDLFFSNKYFLMDSQGRKVPCIQPEQLFRQILGVALKTDIEKRNTP